MQQQKSECPVSFSCDVFSPVTQILMLPFNICLDLYRTVTSPSNLEHTWAAMPAVIATTKIGSIIHLDNTDGLVSLVLEIAFDWNKVYIC